MFSSVQLKSIKTVGERLWAGPRKRGEVPPALVRRGKTLSFTWGPGWNAYGAHTLERAGNEDQVGYSNP